MAEKVDVLFINPGDRRQVYQALGDHISAIEPPIYSGLFATYLRRKGYSSAIFDTTAMGASAVDAALVATEDFDAQLLVLPVYGFQPSASTQNMTSAGKIARLIKDAAPGARILMTGTHPAALPERTMREEAVDFVCDREGPVTILGTLRALKANGGGRFQDVPGLWWRDGEQIVAPTNAAPLIDDLDAEMPGSAWDLLPMERYRAHNWHCFDHIDDRMPYASLYTTLGCPFKCSFCCINAPFGKPSYRMWSPEVVVREIDHLVEKYGIRNIKFVDEMFVLNRRHVLGICDLLIQRDYKVNIWAYARVDTVQDQMLEKLQRAGFNWLALGIESGSDHVRDGAEKKLRDDDIVDTVHRIQNAGIHVLGNYIFGLPDDTRENMQKTLNLAHELNCEFANFYATMAYPGSPLYTTALSTGQALPEKWHHYSQHAYETRPLANDHCSSAEILAFRDRAWDAYFSSPRYLNLVEKKFGAKVVGHLKAVAAVSLKRKLLEQNPAAVQWSQKDAV